MVDLYKKIIGSKFRWMFLVFFVFSFCTALSVMAANFGANKSLIQLIKNELSSRYNGAQIELNENVLIIPQDAEIGDVKQIDFVSESENGIAYFRVQGTKGDVQLQAGFSALVKVPVAIRRIQPRERLSQELFREEMVNIASGQARQMRGLIMPLSSNFSELETRQTILEGQFPVLTGVQRLPDIRRGDPVRLKLISGGLTLTTTGIAQEQAYIGSPVRVISKETKRDIVGTLNKDSIVEVQL